jgi:hypothetical protein
MKNTLANQVTDNQMTRRDNQVTSKPGLPGTCNRPRPLSLIALLPVSMPNTHASRLDPHEALRIE